MLDVSEMIFNARVTKNAMYAEARASGKGGFFELAEGNSSRQSELY